MRAANPAFIPRNHRVEQMIEAAIQGDYGPFHRLNAVLATPYQDQPENVDLTRPPAEDEIVQARVDMTIVGGQILFERAR